MTTPLAHVREIVSGATSLVAVLPLIVLSGTAPHPPAATASGLPALVMPAVSPSNPPPAFGHERGSELRLVLDPEQTKVGFTFGATFHGDDIQGFSELISGEIRFDPRAETASGEIIIDADSTSTENKKRDKHMHEDVLESSTYPRIVFVPTAFEGNFYDDGPSDLNLIGHLDIHGTEHPMTLHAHVVADGDHVQGTTTFDIPYVEWGMKNPSNFLLRVNKVVHVQLQFGGTLSGCSSEGACR